VETVSGLSSTEQRAQRAFEREVLAQIVALCGADGAAPAEQVEQALGHYRHAAAGNTVQELLGRRLVAAAAALQAAGLLADGTPPDCYRPTARGRALVEHARQAWWRRTLAAVRAR
jgi:hypothetical protein